MRILRSFLERELRPLGDAAVMGGLVRDFARGGREAFASDVDIVIDARAGAVSDLAGRLSAQANRFGGFGCRVGPWRVDFWALETTWAVRAVARRRTTFPILWIALSSIGIVRSIAYGTGNSSFRVITSTGSRHPCSTCVSFLPHRSRATCLGRSVGSRCGIRGRATSCARLWRSTSTTQPSRCSSVARWPCRSPASALPHAGPTRRPHGPLCSTLSRGRTARTGQDWSCRE